MLNLFRTHTNHHIQKAFYRILLSQNVRLLQSRHLGTKSYKQVENDECDNKIHGSDIRNEYPITIDDAALAILENARETTISPFPLAYAKDNRRKFYKEIREDYPVDIAQEEMEKALKAGEAARKFFSVY